MGEISEQLGRSRCTMTISCSYAKGLRTRPNGYIQLGLLFNCLDYAGRLGVDMLGKAAKARLNVLPVTH